MLQDDNMDIGQILDNVPSEKNALLSLGKMSKELFEISSHLITKDDRKYECCDKILKLWSKYLLIEHDYGFQILVDMECHLLALEALKEFRIRNAALLFNILMEKTKEFKIDKNRNDSVTMVVLQNLASQKRFCTILMSLHDHWVDDNEDNEEMSVIKIGYILEGLTHLIEMNYESLNTQLFGLPSMKDRNYPLFWYSVCKLMQNWKSEYFEIQDIKNLFILLNAACNNNKFSKTMQKNANDKWEVFKAFMNNMYEIIKSSDSEDDMEARDDTIKQFMKFKQRMSQFLKQ